MKKLGKLGCPIIQLYEPKARSVAYDLLDSINFSIDDIPSAPTNEKHPVRIVDRQVIRYFRGQKSLLPDLIQLDSAIQSFMARKEAKLIIEQESSLLRFAMHSICRFYNLHSSSCNQVVTILAKKCNDIENSMTFIDMIQNT